ncbi:hypothetical protein ACSSS7_007120 [Eimeria intestinalis]
MYCLGKLTNARKPPQPRASKQRATGLAKGLSIEQPQIQLSSRRTPSRGPHPSIGSSLQRSLPQIPGTLPAARAACMVGIMYPVPLDELTGVEADELRAEGPADSKTHAAAVAAAEVGAVRPPLRAEEGSARRVLQYFLLLVALLYGASLRERLHHPPWKPSAEPSSLTEPPGDPEPAPLLAPSKPPYERAGEEAMTARVQQMGPLDSAKEEMPEGMAPPSRAAKPPPARPPLTYESRAPSSPQPAAATGKEALSEASSAPRLPPRSAHVGSPESERDMQMGPSTQPKVKRRAPPPPPGAATSHKLKPPQASVSSYKQPGGTDTPESPFKPAQKTDARPPIPPKRAEKEQSSKDIEVKRGPPLPSSAAAAPEGKKVEPSASPFKLAGDTDVQTTAPLGTKRRAPPPPGAEAARKETTAAPPAAAEATPTRPPGETASGEEAEGRDEDAQVGSSAVVAQDIISGGIFL